MRTIKPYNKAEIINLQKMIEGLIIENIQYSVNIPIEDNCVQINFTDGSYLNIYAMMRIINDNSIILCSSDYYFNKFFQECSDINKIDESLIFDSLKKTNELVKKHFITQIEANDYGDLTIYVDSNLRIEIYFDTPENDKDYYTYYSDNNYFSLSKIANQTMIIEDLYE